MPVAAGQEAWPQSATVTAGAVIRVNGMPVGRAIAGEAGGRAAGLLVAIADIASAIDGTAASGRGRLLTQGARLFATRTGGCRTCPLQVRRPVLLSARVIRREDGAYVPLADLITALEGRVEDPTGEGEIRIRVSVCRWCILEPASRS